MLSLCTFVAIMKHVCVSGQKNTNQFILHEGNQKGEGVSTDIIKKHFILKIYNQYYIDCNAIVAQFYLHIFR